MRTIRTRRTSADTRPAAHSATPGRRRSGWTAPARRRAGRRSPAPRPATSPSSAPASPASGRRCSPRSRTRASTSLVLEAGAVGGQASGRNGGICMASLTHGYAQGAELVPGRERPAARARRREPRADRATPCATSASTAAGSGPASSRSPSAPWQVEGLRELYDQAAGGRHPRRVAGRGGAARRDQVAHVPRRLVAQGLGDRRPGAAGVGPGARLRGAGRAHLRGHARHLHRPRPRRRRPAHSLGRWLAPTASCSPPTPSGRCSGGCGSTSCRCTTTRS